MAHRGSITTHDYQLFRQQDKQLIENLKKKFSIQASVESANELKILASRFCERQEPILVETRIVFLKIGQIDTRNERYDAEAFVESCWLDNRLYDQLINKDSTTTTNTTNNDNKKTPNSSFNKKLQNHPLYAQIQLVKNLVRNLSTFEFDPTVNWTPQLYFDNAIGELKEEITYSLEIVQRSSIIKPNTLLDIQTIAENVNNFTIRVCELRRVRGVFYERLELYNFPMDIQELSITLTSKLSKNQVQLNGNPRESSSISVDEFLDQQEWDLFSYVKISNEFVEDRRRKYERSTYTATGFIARKPGYYLYNAYMLIFLISTLGFIPFSFDPSGPQFRLQTTAVLILTSVNFRWLVTQRIPPVPYLTSLDKYAIGSLFFLIAFCIWHSLIGSNVITQDKSLKRIIDTYVLIIFGVLACAHNLFFSIWFFKKRYELKHLKKDPTHATDEHSHKDDDNNELSVNNQLKRIFMPNTSVYGNQSQTRSTFSNDYSDFGTAFNTHDDALIMHSLI